MKTTDKNKIQVLAFASLLGYSTLLYPEIKTPDHIMKIAQILRKVETGEIRRLILSLPPRHGKTMLTSEYFPAWYLGRHPDREIIATTYQQERANDIGRRVRNHMMSNRHQAVFKNSRLSPDSTAVNRFNLLSGGAYFSVGVGGPITGRGADLLIIDDPIKGREDANSFVIRNKLWEWYQSVAYTRLTPNGTVIVISTRWHEDDLTGRLLAHNAQEKWHVISFPMLAETGDELGRKSGEVLWPEQFSLERAKQIKKTISSREWESLYQQNPLTFQGGTFLHNIWDPTQHVVRPFNIPHTWQRWRAMDWGSAKPYSVGWYALDPDNENIYRYRELYGYGGDPDTGTKETAKQVALKIKNIEAHERASGIEFKNNIADPSIWNNIGNEHSIGEHMQRTGVLFFPAKTGKGSRINGSHEIIQRLKSKTFFVFDTCEHFLRTVPTLPIDKTNAEDVDTNAEDHAWDEWRYSLMSRRPANSTIKQKSYPARNTGTWLEQYG